MPAWDASSRHTIRIAAPPARVYAAARHADFGRPWPVRLLMGLRAVPALFIALVRGRARTWNDRAARRPLGALRFTVVAERPGEELVLGLMGRFWTPTGGVVATTPEQFHAPPPAGLAQALWNFRLTPSGAGSELSTETRVRCGDPATRRRFLRYWRVVRFGSGLIRGSILRSIRAAAEGAPASLPS
jgi:hypothetical protein